MTATTPQLQTTLQQASRAHARVQTARQLCRMLTWLTAAGLFAVAIDAVLSLPPIGLIVIDIAMLSLMVAALASIAKALITRRDQRAAARLLEQQLGLTGSQLINAVDLNEPAGSGQSEVLRKSTVSAGEQLAARVHAGKAIDTAPLHRAGLRLGGIVVVALVFYLLVPSLFQTVWHRYLNPFAGHPAYTFVEFEVDYPDEVFQGKPVVIRAQLSGLNLPDRANVVLIDPESQSALRTQPMLRLDEHVKDASPAPNNSPDTTDGDQPLTFAFRIDQAQRTTDFYIDTPTGRSPMYRFTVLPVPRIEQVTIKYTPPTYTGWPPQTESLGPRGIRNITGTQVTLVAKSNMTLQGGSLAIQPQANAQGLKSKAGKTSQPAPITLQLTPDPATPNIATATFPLTQSGTFNLTLIADNADRTPSDKPRTGRVTALPDRAPTIQITEPANTIIVAPVDWNVPVIVQAEDDVKIASLRMFQQRNEETGQTTDLKYDPAQRLVEVRHAIDLKSMNAQPGDQVKFFATVTDNHPDKPQSADSKRFVIHVISLEDYLNRTRANYQMDDIQNEIDQFQKRLDALDKQRKALEEAFQELQEKLAEQQGQPTAQDLDKLNQLSEQLDQYAQNQLRLAQDMRTRAAQPSLYDFEEAYKEMLKTHGDRLNESANQLIEQRQRYDKHRREHPEDTAEAQRHVERMLRQLQRDAGAQQQAQQDADAASQDTQRIAAADRMAQQVQRIARMVEEQRDLADRLAPFKEKDQLSAEEQLRAQRLAHEQSALHEDLNQALDRLEAEATKSQNQLPRMSASAATIVESIRNLKVPNDQADAADAAIAGRGSDAHRFADAAADKLESLQSETENAQQAGTAELADSPFSLSKMSAGQSLKQLSQGRGLASSNSDPAQTQSNSQGGSVGARAEVSVYGPHAAGNDSTKAKPGARPNGDGQGGTQTTQAGQLNPAEHLTPANPRTHRTSTTGVRGVPAIYQEIADQYLKRLAEDAQ